MMVMMNIWTLICLVRRPSRGRNRSVPLILEQGSPWTLNIHFPIPFQTFPLSFLFRPLLSNWCLGKLSTLNVCFDILFKDKSFLPFQPMWIHLAICIRRNVYHSLRYWEFITYFWENYTFQNVYMLQCKITGKCIIPILCNRRNKIYNLLLIMHKFLKAQNPVAKEMRTKENWR